MNEKKSLQDILSQIAEETGATKKLTDNFLRTLFEITEEALQKDGIAKIPNLGTFKIIAIEERKSVNVQDGTEMIIPAHKKVSFTPEKNLKDEINKPYAHLETYVLNADGPIDTDPEDDNDDDEELLTATIPSVTPNAVQENQSVEEDNSSKDSSLHHENEPTPFTYTTISQPMADNTNTPENVSTTDANNEITNLSSPTQVEQNPTSVETNPIQENPSPVTVDTPPTQVEPSPVTVDTNPIQVEQPTVTVDANPIQVEQPTVSVENSSNVESATTTVQDGTTEVTNNSAEEVITPAESATEKVEESTTETTVQKDITGSDNTSAESADEPVADTENVETKAEEEPSNKKDEEEKQTAISKDKKSKKDTQKTKGKDRKSEKESGKNTNKMWLLWVVLGCIFIVGLLFFLKYVLDKQDSKPEEQAPTTVVEDGKDKAAEAISTTTKDNQEDDFDEFESAPETTYDNPEAYISSDSDKDTNSETTEESSSVDQAATHTFDSQLIDFMKVNHPELNFPSQVKIREEYVVKEGSRLAQISRNVYNGVFNFWGYIYFFNKDVLSSPNDVKPGMTLKIPDMDETFTNSYSEKYKKIADEVNGILNK